MLIQKQRHGWEIVVIALVVTSAMWMTIALYSKRDQVFKERLLINELMTLRNFITATILEHRQIPSSIVHSPSSSSLDPFGNAYHYDPKTGQVFSTTAGYKNW